MQDPKVPMRGSFRWRPYGRDNTQPTVRTDDRFTSKPTFQATQPLTDAVSRFCSLRVHSAARLQNLLVFFGRGGSEPTAWSDVHQERLPRRHLVAFAFMISVPDVLRLSSGSCRALRPRHFSRSPLDSLSFAATCKPTRCWTGGFESNVALSPIGGPLHPPGNPGSPRPAP